MTDKAKEDNAKKIAKRIYDIYSIDEDYICFVNGDGLFYSAEFESLIMSWDVFDGTDYDRRCIERILKDIQGQCD